MPRDPKMQEARAVPKETAAKSKCFVPEQWERVQNCGSADYILPTRNPVAGARLDRRHLPSSLKPEGDCEGPRVSVPANGRLHNGQCERRHS